MAIDQFIGVLKSEAGEEKSLQPGKRIPFKVFADK
jgi:hypothetical protein